MYCKNCGAQLADQAVVCVTCGVPTTNGNNFCKICGAAANPGAAICTKCGCAFTPQFAANPAGTEQKSKLTAGLLGIFLGAYGVHNFYLGYTNKAILQLVLFFFTCTLSSLWGFIEGIMILCGSIKVDGKGIPLKD